MKNLKFLVALGIGALLAGGGIAASVFSVNQNVKPVQAATNYRYYFSPNAGWNKDSASFKIDFRDANGNWLDKRFSMTKLDSASAKRFSSTDVYYYDSSTYYSKLCFGRFSPDGGTQWNYSQVLDFGSSSHSYSFCSMNASNDCWNDWYSSNAKITSSVNATYLASESVSSASTGRLFLNNSESSFGGQTTAIRAWGGSASSFTDASIYNLNWIVDNGAYYGYYDVPTDIDGFQFVTISSDTSYVPNITAYSTGQVSSLSNYCFSGVYYLYNGTNLSLGGAKGDVADSQLMKAVMETYQTCVSNVYNGYDCSSSLKTNFYDHATEAAKSTICDSYSGEGRTVEQKMAMMLKMSGQSSDSKNMSFNFNNESSIVAVAVAVSAASLGGFGILLKKKKFIFK